MNIVDKQLVDFNQENISTISNNGNDNNNKSLSDNRRINSNNKRKGFTRKQLLQAVNKKEKLLINGSSLATTNITNSSPPHLRGEEHFSSCNNSPYNAAAESLIDANNPINKIFGDDAEKKQKDEEISPTSSINSIKDIKNVNFNIEIDENEFISRSIQVTPPLFRLRFVPNFKFKKYCSIKTIFLLILRILLSQLGLTIFLLIWTLLAAYAITSTEGQRESALIRDLRIYEQTLALDLSSELSQVPEKSEWWKIIEKSYRKQEAVVTDALSSGYSPNGGVIWNFAGSLLFAVNMLTTIGFGAPVPRTPLGRTYAGIYSAISIPLNLLLVVNFGALVADKLEMCLRRSKKREKRRNILELGNINTTSIVSGGNCAGGLEDCPPPLWFPFLPVFAIMLYYLFGMAVFGGDPLFPLYFTTAGGVGERTSIQRSCYAIYLEFAIVLAGICINIWKNTASSGLIKIGLKLGLLSRGRNFS